MKLTIKIVLFMLIAAVPGQLMADAAGDGWLKKVDDMMDAVKDSHGTQKMLLIEADGSEKSRTLESWSAGKKSLARFKEPAGVACVGFLTLSAEEMYLYQPTFGKVRRIASHIRNQSFMGSDFSYNDMNRDRVSEKNEAVVKSETEEVVVLEVTPKKGTDPVYDRRVMTVDKVKLTPRTVVFEKEGKQVKKLTSHKVEEFAGIQVMTDIEMENLETGHKTRMLMNYDAVNKGIDSKLFSKRKLQRCR